MFLHIAYNVNQQNTHFLNCFFLFLRCVLHVSNPKVHLQEDGCTYRYGKICLHAEITVRYICKISKYKIFELFEISTCKQSLPYLYVPYNRLPEDEPSGSKHVEGIVKLKY